MNLFHTFHGLGIRILRCAAIGFVASFFKAAISASRPGANGAEEGKDGDEAGGEGDIPRSS